MKKLYFFTICLLVVLLAGCGDDGPVLGAEGGSCYPNFTCNPGLTCASGICVRTPDGWVTKDTGAWDWPWLPDAKGWDGAAPDAGPDRGPDGPVVDAHVFVPDAPVIPDGVITATCGDGVVNQSVEHCDGSDLAKKSCYDLPGYDFGSLGCNSNCTFDTADCKQYSFKTLAAGSFTMGSHYTEPCRDTSDEDQHTVSLTNSFRIATTPVTQEQFNTRMGYNPSTSSTVCSDCPVNSVTWHEAAAYGNALSKAASVTSCYTCAGTGPFVSCTVKSTYLGVNIYSCPGYRVPTEAEWEYAYRAGTYTAYYSGANSLTTCNDCSTQELNAHRIAWYCNNSSTVTMPVGLKLVNKWGLYDMAGNVAEWTHDFYQASLGTALATNPAGPATGTFKVRRGMSSDRMPHGLRGAERDSAATGYPGNQFSGFRPVQTIAATPPTCGNGVLNSGEQCDGTFLNNKTCVTEGYTGGVLTCSTTCQLITSNCTGTKLCGNGKIDTGEQCDGTNVGLTTCIGLNFKGGTLACGKTCKFDTTGCTLVSFCGDGKIDGQEACDGSNLNAKTCKSMGYASGTLACTTGCALNTNGCTGTSTYCGNSKIDSGEDCDGTNVGLTTCIGLGFKSGTLGCTSLCKFDSSKCTPVSFCGDGKVEGQEVCDGSNHNSKTCKTQGYASGVLACKSCVFDVTGCSGTASTCGNGVINSKEQCDGTNFGGVTCSTLGLGTGTLTCSSTCQRVTTGCTSSATCGNGVINSKEQCDGTNFGGLTCASLGFTGGALSCSSTCQRVTSACTGSSASCGDGFITGSEQCDGTNLGGYTCSSMSLGTGTLACNSTTCRFNTSGCSGSGSTPAFINIKAGSFYMGSPSTEPCRLGDGVLETRHQVTLSNAFSMMGTEVTQASFKAVMGYNYSINKTCGVTCPVDTVSWHEAVAYANKLSVANSLTPCYSCSGTAPAVTCTVATAYNGSNIYSCPGYRLPTEAEWEYAYRAGTTTAYYNGANSSTYCYSCTSLEVNAGLIGHYCANSTTTFNWLVTRPVRQKAANAWGLDDMAGNVQEWVHDGYQNNLGSSAVTNPVVNPTGNYRMLRGARVPYAWPHGMRAAYRYISGPTNKNQGIGFRLVRRGSSGT